MKTTVWVAFLAFGLTLPAMAEPALTRGDKAEQKNQKEAAKDTRKESRPRRPEPTTRPARAERVDPRVSKIASRPDARVEAKAGDRRVAPSETKVTETRVAPEKKVLPADTKVVETRVAPEKKVLPAETKVVESKTAVEE